VTIGLEIGEVGGCQPAQHDAASRTGQWILSRHADELLGIKLPSSESPAARRKRTRVRGYFQWKVPWGRFRPPAFPFRHLGLPPRIESVE
jgi:hypothetical protein